MDIRRACICLAVVGVLMLAIVSAAFGAEASSGLPQGRYDGSAIGSKAGAQPFGVTVYITDVGNGKVEVTAVTSKLPIPVTVQGVAAAVPGGWDIPVSASISALDLNGTGIARLRARGNQWVLFGEGTGSYKGSSGGGTASGVRTSDKSTAGEQVIAAATGFLSFGKPAAEAAPKTPEKYVAADWKKNTDPPSAANVDPSAQRPISAVAEAIIIVCLILLALIFAQKSFARQPI
jgi:hypothetical protein